jgi:hypothetical protein
VRVARVTAGKRVSLSLLAAVLCMIATSYTGPILTVVLVLLMFGFVADAVTLLWSRGGGLGEHRQ